MVTAFALIQVEPGRVAAVAERLAEIDGVAEAYSVAGRFDQVAVLRVPDNEAMARLVSSSVLGLPGIVRTETLPAFRAYSRHDLDALFDLGDG